MTRRDPDDRHAQHDAQDDTRRPAAPAPARSVALDSASLRRRVAAQSLDFPPITWPAPQEASSELPTVPAALSPAAADDAPFAFAPARAVAESAPRRQPRGLVWGPPVELSGHARRWLVSIPRRWRPRALAAQYPHVVNRLAVAWGDRPLVERCFDDLMIDRRGERQGFPRAVSAEILALHGYYLRLFDRRVRLVSLDTAMHPTDDPTVPMRLEWRDA